MAGRELYHLLCCATLLRERRPKLAIYVGQKPKDVKRILGTSRNDQTEQK